MKFYSDVTKKLYDSKEDCIAAEKEVEKKNSNRKVAAEKVEAKFEALTKAKKEYYDELNEFCKQYGAYHNTISADKINSLKDFLDWDIFF